MADGITRIAVEGFKSIVNRQEIEVAPLTILAGANSSGKSSIMQPLLLLKQTLEATYDPGPLKIDGPNVMFTSSDQFLSRKAGSLTVGFSVDGLGVEVDFSKDNTGIELVEQRERYLNGNVRVLRPEMSLSETQPGWVGEPRPHLIRARCFLRWGFSEGWPINPFVFDRGLQDLIHVPGLRGNRARVYPITASGPQFQGIFDNYTASVILGWQKEKSRNYENLNEDIQTIGLAKEVYAHRPNEVTIELYIGGVVPDRTVNIADVGFGVSQVLPVLVALRAADEGRLVYLEEPEVDLHPRAQTKLADVLAEAAKRGVRVVAETHSSLLLRAIQTLVAKGDFDPELVRLHWFSRDSEGITHVTTAKLDENGAFGDWPEDFGDVALDSEKQYLDAVEDRLTH